MVKTTYPFFFFTSRTQPRVTHNEEKKKTRVAVLIKKGRVQIEGQFSCPMTHLFSSRPKENK